MRVFAIAADVIMGAILGLFLFVVVKDVWPGGANPAMAIAVFAAGIFLALVRGANSRAALSETGRRR